jgi:hypothetical protein
VYKTFRELSFFSLQVNAIKVTHFYYFLIILRSVTTVGTTDNSVQSFFLELLTAKSLYRRNADENIQQ